MEDKIIAAPIVKIINAEAPSIGILISPTIRLVKKGTNNKESSSLFLIKAGIYKKLYYYYISA
jgi:hypothetical protein